MQVDTAGIDILLVGDSVAMVVHGHDTTLPVTLDEMILHCKAVYRGARRYLPHCMSQAVMCNSTVRQSSLRTVYMTMLGTTTSTTEQ